MPTDPSIPWARWATPGQGPEFRFTGRRRFRLTHRLRHRQSVNGPHRKGGA